MNGLGIDIVIFHSRVAAQCHERALVLRAMGIEHAVLRREGEWMLVVPEQRVGVAVEQLDAYIRENRDWPRAPRVLPHHPLGLSGVAGCVTILLLVAAAQSRMAFDLDWFDAGRIDTDMVRHGEWWRTVTALTLHLDAGHLIGNIVLGSVFGLVAARLLGDGLAWLSIVLAGAVGNGVSAVVQIAPHSAVGASTAVFAALGLIAAYVWRGRDAWRSRWAVHWAPIIVALVLLAWTGSGGGRTDVVAHLTGFLAGIAFGAYIGSVTAGARLGARSQWLMGLCAVVIVGVSWAIALGAHG